MRSKKIKSVLDTRIELKLSNDHYEYLKYLSQYHNCSIQQIVRMIIDNEYIKFKYKE